MIAYFNNEQVDFFMESIMYIPEKHKTNLIKAYKECSQIITNFTQQNADFNHVPEPIKTALIAEEHRWFWKPKTVKFVLVAESHVYTGRNDIKVTVDPTKLPSGVPTSVPLNFVRLVYCLGYGSSNILRDPQKIKSNPGTSQYTNMFAKFIGLGKKPRKMTRLEWKTKVLKAAEKHGIWLLDASVHACYLGKRRRLPQKLVKRIVPVSWQEYVEPIINNLSIDEKHIWIIGKTLHGILAPASLGIDWIYQPNARFRNPELYKEKRDREAKVAKVIQKMRI